MRRVSLIGLLMIGLSACGVAEPPTAVPTAPSAQSPAYPAPIVPAPAPPQPPAAATAAPTVAAAATAAATPASPPVSLTVTLAQTFTLEPLTGPHYLVGWAPDDSEILYVQGGDLENTNQVYVVNPTTGSQELLDAQAFGGKQGTQYIATEYAAPQWTERCCEVRLGHYQPDGTQELRLIDRQTQQVESAGVIAQGVVSYEADGTLLLGNAQGIQPPNGQPLKRALPALSDSDVLISLRFNQHGQALLLSDPTTLQVLDLHDSTHDWTLNAADLKSKTDLKNLDISLDHLKIRTVRWSPDGTRIAFLLAAAISQEVWVMRSDGTDMHAVQMVEGAYASNLAWSPDNTMLAYTETNTGTSPLKSLYVVNTLDNTATIIDGDVYSNAIWNREGTEVAVYEVGANVLRIYAIEQ